MSNDKPENFIGRWSRLKQRARGASEALDETEVGASRDAGGDGAVTGDPGPAGPEGADAHAGESAVGHGAPSEGAASKGERPRMLTAKDFADVDFDALDFDSDYTRFMGRDVPDDIRNRALGKLWGSNPLLANMDGLDDYIDDYTDAAVAVPAGTLKTAYKIGQGFLSDEEAAEWDRLGKPEPEVASGDPTGADATETAAVADLAATPAAAPGAAAGEGSPVVAAAVAADAWSRTAMAEAAPDLSDDTSG